MTHDLILPVLEKVKCRKLQKVKKKSTYANMYDKVVLLKSIEANRLDQYLR